jgi:dimethylaniline monooxygenase (N-oxide forming)
MKNGDGGTIFDVIILGAGWSGLLACKYCLGEGLNVLALESRDTIGGIWAYTEDKRFAGVMKTTQTTSSRCITEISDFPMPANYPDFPSHGEILSYLKSYCDEFRLHDHILLGRSITKVEGNNGGWEVKCSDGTEFRSRNIIMSTGVHQRPNTVAADPRFSHYTGTILHSAAVKEISSEYANKTVIVWGGGESASDIAFEASKVAKRVYLCIPNGQWFVPKVVDRWPPFPSDRRKIVDHTSSRLRLFLSPTHRFSPLISQYLQHAFGFNGHGQEAWRTDAPYNRSFFNKSSEVLSRVNSGHVIPKRDIADCEGKKVFFTDGTSIEADITVTCSGYTAHFPAFAGGIKPTTDPRHWYKYVFYNEDPSLAFVGFVRPIFGSIPGIAELQSRYVAKVFAGQRSLPPKEERSRIITEDAVAWNHHFRYTSLRLHGLVDHFLYSGQLAKLIGCRPRFAKLFCESPRKWWKAITAPWNGCQFWLNDKSQHERVFKTLARYEENRISEIYAFVVLAPLLPFIGFCTQARVFWNEHILRKRPFPGRRAHD